MKNLLMRALGLTRHRYFEDSQKSLSQLLQDEALFWKKSIDKASHGDKILIATSMGCYEHAVIVESTLAVALTLRKAKVDILLCDRAIPCCQMTKIFNVSPDDLLSLDDTPRCDSCIKKGIAGFKPLDLKVSWFSEYLDPDDVLRAQEVSKTLGMDKIATYRENGIAIGEHALAGALRYYARGDLNNEARAEPLLRRYFKASLLTAMAMQNLLLQNPYDCAVFHHGIYVPQGIIGEVCRNFGVRVVNWNPSYRKQTFIFSHDDSYHHTMITEPTAEWEDIRWNKKREKKITDYLKSRWSGSQDWIWFHEKPYEDIEKIQKELGMHFDKPTIGMLTSVMWDAQLHYNSNAFENMLDWMLTTIEYFSGRPDLQLLIRIHPAEVTGLIPSRQKMSDEIKAHFNSLPENVRVIPPDSHISTYAVIEKCNAVIIYNTKTGIEISAMGIPVIVAGEAWIRNKGFSMDASSPSDYVSILKSLPTSERLSESQLLRARKYAYHFFFRRMIELPFMVSTKKHKFMATFSSLKDLQRKHYPGLDAICNGILNGTSFVSQSHPTTDERKL